MPHHPEVEVGLGPSTERGPWDRVVVGGGYGEAELERAGAYRVYEHPADLLRHLDEVGIRAIG